MIRTANNLVFLHKRVKRMDPNLHRIHAGRGDRNSGQGTWVIRGWNSLTRRRRTFAESKVWRTRRCFDWRRTRVKRWGSRSRIGNRVLRFDWQSMLIRMRILLVMIRGRMCSERIIEVMGQVVKLGWRCRRRRGNIQVMIREDRLALHLKRTQEHILYSSTIIISPVLTTEITEDDVSDHFKVQGKSNVKST